MPVSLSNSKDIVANSISIIKGNEIIDVLDSLSSVQGFPPDVLNSLEKLANALDNDPNFYTNIAQSLNQKANTTYVNTQLATKADQLTTYTKTETDTLLGSKANQTTTYSKTETDTLLNNKANQTTTYTKTDTDTLLGTKANQADVNTQLATKANQTTTYTKTETDTLLNNKASQATTYTKTETDTLLNNKANQTTTYTKTETDTLLDTKANQTDVTTQLATKANQTTTYTKTETNTLLGTKANLSLVNTIIGLETLVKPSDSSKISLPLQNSEGTFILSNDNQTFDLSFKPAGSAFSISGLTYNNTSGLTVNNDLNANIVNSSTLNVSGLNIIDELNTKATTTALTNGLSSKVNTSTFTTAINQKADLSLVNTIVGLETLVKPSDNSKISLPLQNSEGTFILSNDNQTFDLSFKPAGSAFSLSGLTYNNTSGLTVNNDLSANNVNSSTLSVSGLNIIDELNTKATTTALTNGLSSKVNATTFTTAINQKADLSLVNTIVGLQTLINNNIETILPIESNGSSTKFRFRVGNNALRIEKFDNVGSVVLDDWVTVLTLSLDDSNAPVLMLGDLNVKSELASKASISYVDNAIANVQPVSGGSAVLTNYVSPLEASLDGLKQYSLYRSGKTVRLQVKPSTQYGIKLSSSSSITWSNVALVPDNSFTFETWFYSDRAGGAPNLLDIRGNNKSITVNKDGGGRLQILSNDANLNLNVNGYVPPAGQWIHLVVQNDVPNNIFRVYVNGSSTLLNSASSLTGWSTVSSVTVSISMSEGYNIFSNIKLSLGAIYGTSAVITPSLPLDKNNATKFLVQGNTTNDIIQNKQGGFIGSVILETLSDSLITETAIDGDIQVVKVTANDVRTNNLGISKKSNNGNLFSVIDETTLGGTTFDPVIVAGVPMTCTSVSCTSLTVAGVPVTGIYNPYWVAGRWDGVNMVQIGPSKGRYAFTVTRSPSVSVGAYRISWTQPHPDGVDFIVSVNGEGTAWAEISNGYSANGLYYNTSTSFDVFFRTADNNASNVNCPFSFFVIA